MQAENVSFKYALSKVLKMMNVPSKEFAKCWNFIKKNTTHEELFCLVKDAGFGPRDVALFSKVAFVRKVLQRYKDANVVWVSVFQSCPFYWIRVYEYACLFFRKLV